MLALQDEDIFYGIRATSAFVYITSTCMKYDEEALKPGKIICMEDISGIDPKDSVCKCLRSKYRMHINVFCRCDR
jgi:hypothetical protein